MIFFSKIGTKYWILFAIVCIPIFGYLGTLPIRLWDESRLAVNALEMANNGNWMVTHYNGNPDLWNTKPPLLIWLQAILIKVIGTNELAIRLPSAVAALITCASLSFFSIKYLRNFWLGFITPIVLVACQGYITEHVTRTGDYDTLLTLFTTLLGLFAFLYIDTKQKKYIYLFFGACMGGVLTKGIAGLLFLPGIFFFVLLQKECLSLFKNRHFLIALSLFIITILSYYIVREYLNSGYLNAVWKNELGGRFIKTNEGHAENSWFYINEIFSKDLLFVLSILIIPGAFIGLTSSKRKTKKFFRFSIITVISFTLVISVSQTKLNWYEAPVYPWLAFFIANFIEYDFSRLRSFIKDRKNVYLKLTPYMFLVSVLLIPYSRSIKRIYKPKEHKWNDELYEVSYYLRSALKKEKNLEHQFLLILKDSANPHELFYLNALRNKGVSINTKALADIKKGETVFSAKKWAKDSIQKNFLYSILDTNGNITTFKIHEKRNKDY